MAIVITKNPCFWAPAFLVIPADEGTITFKFRLRFKRLPTERNREILRAIGAMPPEEGKPKPAPITDRELLDEVLADWDKFTDEDGKPVPYTPAARAQVVADYFGMEAAMARSFIDHAWPEQIDKAAEKN